MKGGCYEMRSGLLCAGYERFVCFSILIVNELYMWSRRIFDGVIVRRGFAKRVLDNDGKGDGNFCQMDRRLDVTCNLSCFM